MMRLLKVLAVCLLCACSDDSTSGGADGGRIDGGADEDMGRQILDARPPDAAPDAAPDGPVIELDAALPDAQEPDVMPPDAAIIVFDRGVPDAFPDAIIRDERCELAPMLGEQPAIDLEPRCSGPDAPLRIRDLRDARCPRYQRLPTGQPGLEVELEEAVVTGIYGNDFTVQDPEGGAWSGAFVYGNFEVPPEGLRVGSRVALNVRALEFFQLTELVRDRDDDVVIIGQGDPPDPVFIADASRIADEGDLAEAMESVLVEVRDVRVTSTAPDCPREFGMFVVTGGLRVDDDAPFDYQPAKNDIIDRLVGPTSYTFSHFKILPRGDADITRIDCGGIPDKCEATPCPVEPDAEETGALIITEIQNNPRGDDDLREFVEIYNPSPAPLVVDGWRVQDCAGNEAPLAGMIPPRSYYVLARSVDRDDNGGVPAQADMGDLFLPNAYGSVLIFDAENDLVDQVRYEPGGEVWPERRAGESLELIERAADNRLGAAWAPGRDEYGPGGRGTPGQPYRD